MGNGGAVVLKMIRSVAAVVALSVLLGGLLGQAGSSVAAAGGVGTSYIPSAPGPAHLRASEPDAGERWAGAARAKLITKLNPDPENPVGALIEVDKSTQTLTAWNDGDVVYHFLISTARPGYSTPAGHFEILGKWHNYFSKQWSVWMPEAMLFHGDYFLHSLPYKEGSNFLIGGSRLGTADSHGCVRIGPANARKLYEWANVGTTVWIH